MNRFGEYLGSENSPKSHFIRKMTKWRLFEFVLVTKKALLRLFPHKRSAEDFKPKQSFLNSYLELIFSNDSFIFSLWSMAQSIAHSDSKRTTGASSLSRTRRDVDVRVRSFASNPSTSDLAQRARR